MLVDVISGQFPENIQSDAKPFFLGQLFSEDELLGHVTATSRLTEALKYADSLYDPRNQMNELLSSFEAHVTEIAEVIDSMGHELPAIRWEFSQQFLLWLSRSRTNEIEQFRRDAKNQLASIKDITETSGRVHLSGTFESTAKSALRGSRLWNFAVAICVIIGIALPTIILSNEENVLTALHGTAGFIIKALTGIPLFALAIYCGKIAAQHRDVWRHLTILIAQINSVNAYINKLDKNHRDEIILLLGKRAYSDPGLTDRDKNDADVDSILEKVLAIVKATQ